MSPTEDDDGIVDIEDIIGFDGSTDIERISHNELIVRPKMVTVEVGNKEDKEKKEIKIQDDEDNLTSFLPGTHKIFVKTWGCSHNNSDGEYMAGLLASSGYPIVSSEDEAHLIVLNSCTVKNPAEDHFRNAINSAKIKGKHVVVAGCVSQATPNADYLKNLSIVGVQQIDRVVEVVEETLKGNKVRLLGKKKVNRRKAGGASLNLPKIRRNPLIEIIPISTGCLNQCTYCKTKHARGDLGSYPIEEIVSRAIEAFKEGCKEIWLTSEDTGAYGKDIGLSLPQLLYVLVDVIPDGCYLRLGMTNPPYIKEHLADMVRILSHPRVYSFLHIPVQSGSDQVLADMKREYCCLDFEEIVIYLRERVPGITIATDIICGFPTETEDDFEETIKLVDKYRFPSLFINQYYPRPGTVAAKMKRIPANKVRERTKRLTELFESYLPYEGREGCEVTVLVTEESRDKRYWVGHNKYYEQILIPKDTYLMGCTLRVRIVSTARYYMFGQPLNYIDRLSSSLKSLSFSLKEVKKSIAIVTGLAILTSGLLVYIKPKLRL